MWPGGRMAPGPLSLVDQDGVSWWDLPETVRRVAGRIHGSRTWWAAGSPGGCRTASGTGGTVSRGGRGVEAARASLGTQSHGGGELRPPQSSPVGGGELRPPRAHPWET